MILFIIIYLAFCVINSASTSTEFCLSPFTEHEGQCFNYDSKSYAWYDAKSHCENIGGNIAVGKDEVQAKAIKDFLQATVSSSTSVWLGATDAEQEGDWKWIDGTPFNTSSQYLKWGVSGYSGQEPNGGEGENCLIYYRGYGEDTVLGDYICGNSYHTLCQGKKQACKAGYDIVGNVCMMPKKTKKLTAVENFMECKKDQTSTARITPKLAEDLNKGTLLKDGESYWMIKEDKYTTAKWNATGMNFKFETPTPCEKHYLLCHHGYYNLSE